MGRLSARYLVARPRVTHIQVEIAFEVPRNFQLRTFGMGGRISNFELRAHLYSLSLGPELSTHALAFMVYTPFVK